MKIAIDFDGTIVKHKYPKIGDPVPDAIEWIRKFQEAGAKIILYTMRSDGGEYPNTLKDAVKYLEIYGIKLFGVNRDPEQDSWTSSHKCYANLFIDDAAFGCQLLS